MTLCRASTSSLAAMKKGVDGRNKSGHDVPVFPTNAEARYSAFRPSSLRNHRGRRFADSVEPDP